jgi:hypothetical protein
MASVFHQSGIAHFLGAGNFGTDTLKMPLLKSTYAQNKDHNDVGDLATTECDATGYTGGFGGAGRKTLATPTITVDDANDRLILDAADPAPWNPLGGATNNTLRYGAIIKEITSDALSIVLATLDMGADQNTNGGSVTVSLHATLGIGTITC